MPAPETLGAEDPGRSDLPGQGVPEILGSSQVVSQSIGDRLREALARKTPEHERPFVVATGAFVAPLRVAVESRVLASQGVREEERLVGSGAVAWRLSTALS